MRFDYMIFFPKRQIGNALGESVGNYAKEGGSESRARRPPLHSSLQARLENKGLTSDCNCAMIGCSLFHMKTYTVQNISETKNQTMQTCLQ